MKVNSSCTITGVSGFDDQASLFSEPRNHGDDSSDSSSSSSHSFSRASSVCPVDTTYTEVDPRTMEGQYCLSSTFTLLNYKISDIFSPVVYRAIPPKMFL